MGNRADIPWYEQTREEYDNAVTRAIGNSVYFLGLPLGYLALRKASAAINSSYASKIYKEIDRYNSKIAPSVSVSSFSNKAVVEESKVTAWSRRQASVGNLIAEVVKQHRKETDALGSAPSNALRLNYDEIRTRNSGGIDALVRLIRKQGLSREGKQAADELTQRSLDQALYADATKNPLLVDILKSSKELDVDQVRVDPNLNRFVQVLERSGKFIITRVERAVDRSFVLHVMDPSKPDRTARIPVPSLDSNAASTNPFSARTAVTTSSVDLLRTDVPVTRQVITHGGFPKVFPSRAYLTADGLPVEVNGTMQYLMDLERMAINARDVDDLNIKVNKYINANLIDPTVGLESRSTVVPVAMDRPDSEPGAGTVRRTRFETAQSVKTETRYYKHIKNINAPKIIRKEAARHGVFMDLDRIYMEILDSQFDPTKAEGPSADNTIKVKRLPELTTETFRHLGEFWRERNSKIQKRRKVRRPIETDIKLEPRRYGMSTISPAAGIDSSDPYIILHDQLTNPDKSINYGAARDAEDYVINKVADDATGDVEVTRGRNNTITFKLKNGKRRVSYSVSFQTEAQANSFDSYLGKKIMKIIMDHHGKGVSDLFSNLGEVLAEVDRDVQKRKGVIRRSNIKSVSDKISQIVSDFAGTDMHIYAGAYSENVERVPTNVLRKTLRSLRERKTRIQSYIKRRQIGSGMRSVANKALQHIDNEELEIKKQLSSSRNRRVGLIIDTPDQFDSWGRYKGKRQSYIDRKAGVIEELILPKKLAQSSGIDLDGAIMLDSGDTKFNRQMELKNLTIRIITDKNGKTSVHMETSKSGAQTTHTITEEKEVQKVIKQMATMERIARRRAGRNYAASSNTEDYMRVGTIKVGNRNYDMVTGVRVQDGIIRTSINEKNEFGTSFAKGTEYKVYLAYEDKSTAFKLSKGDANSAKSMHVIHNRDTIINNPILKYFDNGRSSIISGRGKLREQPRTRGNIGVGAFIKLSEETFGGILDTAYNNSSIPTLLNNGVSGPQIKALMVESMVNVAYSMNLGTKPVPKVEPLDRVKMKAEHKEQSRQWVKRNFEIRLVGNGSDRRVEIGVRDNVDMSKLHAEVDKNIPTFEFTQGKMIPQSGGGYRIEPAKRLKYGLFDDYTTLSDKPILDNGEWVENSINVQRGLLTRQKKLWSDIARQITNETRTSAAFKGILTPEQQQQLRKFRLEIGNSVTESEIEAAEQDRRNAISKPSTYKSEVFTATDSGPVFRVKSYHTTHSARAYTGKPNLGVNVDLPNLFMMGVNNSGFVKNLAHMMQAGNDWMVQHLLYSNELIRRDRSYGAKLSSTIKINKSGISSRINSILFNNNKTLFNNQNPFLDSRSYASSADIVTETNIEGARKYVKLRDRIDSALKGTEAQDAETLPTGFRVELEVDGEESMQRKLMAVREHLEELVKSSSGLVKKDKRGNIYNLNLGKLITDHNGEELGKLSIPLIIDEDEVIAAIKGIKGEQNSSTMIASAVKGTNTAFSYQVLGLIETLGYIKNAKNIAEDRKAKYTTATINQLLEAVRSHASRVDVSTGTREGALYHNFYKRELYGSRFTATTNTGNVAQSGTLLMTREYAQDFLIGDSRVASEARRFQTADKIKKVINRHFKEIHGLLPENIRNGITNADELINRNTANELIDLMQQIMDRSTGSSDRKTIQMRRAIEGLRQMSGSTDFIDGVNWLVAHNKIWNDTNGYVKTIGSIYKAVRTRMANIMRGGAEVVMAQRPPTHGPGDYIPLFAKIAKPNIKQIVERQGGVMMNASDIAMAFGDIDGDIMNAITKGYQTIWSQDNSDTAIRSRIEELRETYMARSYYVSTRGGVRASNYMAEKAMRSVIEHNNESVVNFRKLNEVFMEQIDILAKQTGKSPAEIIGSNKDILSDILNGSLYVVDTTPQKPDTKYKIINALDRNGNPFGKIITNKDAPVGSYSLLYETGRSSSEAAKLKESEIEIRESIKATTNAFGLEEETYRAAMGRTHSAAIQKEAAGTPYRTVLKLNHMFGYLQKVPFDMSGSTHANFEFIKKALLKTGKFGPNSGIDVDLLAEDFTNVVSDKVLKPLAEQYALKAKHGILNIVEPVISEIEKLSKGYFTYSESDRIGKSKRGDSDTIDKRINRLLNVEDLYIKVDADNVDAVYFKDRIRVGDYRDYMQRKFDNVDTLIKKIGGEELDIFNAQHDISNNPEGRLKILTDKIDKMTLADVNKLLDDNLSGENHSGYKDFKRILSNKDYTSREKVIQLLAARSSAGEVVAGVARMKHSLELNRDLLHGMLAVSSSMHQNATTRGAISQFLETFDALQDLISRGKTSSMEDFIERVRTKGSKDALEYLTGGKLVNMGLFPEGNNTPFGEYPRSQRPTEFNPLRGVSESSMARVRGLAKGAALGTLLAIGIENLIGGSPVSETKNGAGKGGEYWEKRSAKEAETMIKPLPPMVEKNNPSHLDAMSEYEKLARNNSQLTRRSYEPEEQKYKQSSRGMIIR